MLHCMMSPNIYSEVVPQLSLDKLFSVLTLYIVCIFGCLLPFMVNKDYHLLQLKMSGSLLRGQHSRVRRLTIVSSRSVSLLSVGLTRLLAGHGHDHRARALIYDCQSIRHLAVRTAVCDRTRDAVGSVIPNRPAICDLQPSTTTSEFTRAAAS